MYNELSLKTRFQSVLHQLRHCAYITYSLKFFFFFKSLCISHTIYILSICHLAVLIFTIYLPHDMVLSSGRVIYVPQLGYNCPQTMSAETSRINIINKANFQVNFKTKCGPCILYICTLNLYVKHLFLISFSLF